MAKMDIDGVKVCIRSRPLLQREENNDLYWDVDSSEVKHRFNKEKPYYFNRIFNGKTTTKEVFEETAMPIVDKAMEGFNGTIFAYGQTSSGKTHTMMGNEENPGIIPMSVKHIFDCIQATPDREFLLRVSYLEIYNETLHDLLNTEVVPLKIRENVFKSVSISGLEEIVARSFDDVMALVAKGHECRSVAATNMNDKSSRSHAVFRIIIESRERMQDFAKDDETAVWVAQLNMVDLAGSERSNSAGTEGSRLTEGCYINKSLSNLCKVIAQINTNKFISFRDSKLTRILQSSLGGNSLTAIICTITVASEEETRSTLRFASSAMKVKNKPQFNEVLSEAAVLIQHKREIVQLKKKLSELEKEIREKSDETGSERLKKEFYEKIDYYKGMFLVSTLPSIESTTKKAFNRRMTWAPSAIKPAGSNESNKPQKVVRSSENFCTAEQFLNVLNRTDPVGAGQSLKRRPSKNSTQAKRLKTDFDLSDLDEVNVSDENDQLKEQLKDEVGRSSNLQSRVELYEEKLKQKDAELAQIRMDMTTQQTDADSKIQALKHEVAEFKRRENPDTAGLRRSNESLLAQLQDACRETRKVQQQCDQYINRNSNLTQQLNDLTLEMSQIKEQNDNKTSSDETNDVTATSSDELALLNQLLSNKNKIIEELELKMGAIKKEHEVEMKDQAAKSLFGDVFDISLDGVSPNASKTISSPMVFGKNNNSAENGALLKAKDEEIRKLKADLAQAEETVDFNENEKLIHSEEEKTWREEIAKLNGLIEAYKEELATLKSELKKQGERFAETFNPENEEEKKKIEELMRIVKDYERNSSDAQIMYQETNKQVSQLTTDKQKLEDITKKQKIEIENLKNDVESYKAMADITGKTTSNRMQRSICEPFDLQDENLPEFPPVAGGGLSLEDELRQADGKTIATLQDQLQLVENELKDEKYRVGTIRKQLEDEQHSHQLVVDQFAQFRVEMESKVKPILSDANTSSMNFETSVTDVKSDNEGELERLRSELKMKEQEHFDKMQQTSLLLKTAQTKVEKLELRVNEVLEEKQKCEAEGMLKISHLESQIEERVKDQSENRAKELAAISELENRIKQLAEEKGEYEAKESKLESQIEQLLRENGTTRNECSDSQKEMIIDGRLTPQERAGLMKRIDQLTAENDQLRQRETQANNAQLGDDNVELETLKKLEQSEVKIQSTNEVWAMERDRNNKEIERLETLLSERQSSLMKMSSEKDIAEHKVGKLQDQCKMLENEKSELESSLNAKNFGVGSGFFGGRSSGIMGGDSNYERLETRLKTQSFNLDLTKQRLAEVELLNKNLKDEQRKIDNEHYTSMKKLTDELQELRSLQRMKDDEIESLKEDIKRIKMKYEREITEADQMVETFRKEIQNLQGVCEKSSDNQKRQKEEISRLQEESKKQLESKLKISDLYDSLQKEVDQLKKESGVLATDSEHFKAQNECLKVENESINSEKDALKTENKTVKDENEVLKNENENVRSEKEALIIENETVKSENEDLKNENESIKAEKESLKTENEDLKNGKGDENSKYEHLTVENESLKTLNENYKSDLEIMETQNHDLMIENRGLKTRNEEYKNENESLKTENESLKVENSNLNSGKEALKIENETVKNENHSLNNEKERITVASESYRTEINTLETENNSLKAAYDDSKSENESLKFERQNLTNENNSLKTENENLKIENEILVTEQEILKAENEDLSNKNGNGSFKDESLQTPTANLEEQNQNLTIENEDLKAQNEDYKNENESLKTQNECLKVENENVRSEKEAVIIENETVKIENEDLKNENESIKAEKESLKTENEGLKNDKSRGCSKEENLEAENESLKTLNENYRTEAENMKGQNQNLRVENEDLKTRNEDYQNKNESLKQTYEIEMQKCTNAARTENEALKQQSESLKTEHAQEKERLAETHRTIEQGLMEEMETLKRSISTLQEEISRLKEERLEEANLLEEVEKCNEDLVAERNDLRTKLAGMEERNDLLKQDLAKRESELRSLMAEKETASQHTACDSADDHSACKLREEELKDEMDDLKLEARRRNAFIEDLEEQNKDARDDCSRLKGDLAEGSAQLNKLKSRYETLQMERDDLIKQREDKVAEAAKISDALKLQLSELEAKLSETRAEGEKLKAANTELVARVNEADMCMDPDFHRRRMLLEDHTDLSEAEQRFLLAYDSYNQEMEKNATCQREIEDLRAHIEDQQRVVEAARKSAEEAADAGSRVSSEVDQVRQRAEDAEKKLSDLRFEMEELVEQSTSLERELSDKRDKLQAADGEKVEAARQLAAMSDDVTRLEREKKKLSAEYQEAQSRLVEAEEQCEKLSRAARERKVHPVVDQRKLTELTDERDAAVEEKMTAEKKLENYVKFAHDTISDSQVQLQEINNDFQSSRVNWEEEKLALKTEIEAKKANIEFLEEQSHKMNIELTQIRNEVRSYRTQYDNAHEERQSFVRQINAKDQECADLKLALNNKQREIQKFDLKWKEHQKMSEEAVARSKEEIKSNCLKFQAQLLDYDRLKAENRTKQEKLLLVSKQLTECELKYDKFAKETTMELQTITKQLQQKETEVENLRGQIKELKEAQAAAAEKPKRLQPSDYQREKEEREVPTSSNRSSVRRSGRLSTEVEEFRSKLSGRKKEYEEIFYDLEWRIPFYQECKRIGQAHPEVKAICDKWSKRVENSGEISATSRRRMIEKFTEPGRSEGIRTTRSGTASSVINTRMPCPTDNLQQQMKWLKLKSDELKDRIEFTIQNSEMLLNVQNENRRFRRELNNMIAKNWKKEDQDMFNQIADRCMESANMTTFKFDKIRSKQPEPAKKGDTNDDSKPETTNPIDNQSLGPGKSKCRPISESDDCKQM